MNQRKSHIIVDALLVLVVLLALSACGSTPTPTPTPPPIPAAPPLMEFGINGLNGPRQANGNASEAVAVGAVRDRWSVEWFWVEQPWREDDDSWGLGEGQFGWQGVFHMSNLDPAEHDYEFNVHTAAGGAGSLQPLVALHGVPRIYDCTQTYVDPPRPSTDDIYERDTECDIASDPYKSRILGLFEDAVVGGAINPNNRWANFAFATMQYLSSTYGIVQYQVWNEPDLQWRGYPDPGNQSGKPEQAWVNDYVRLIQITGEAAQLAGNSTLVLGAPSSNEKLYEPDNWVYEAWRSLNPFAGHLNAIAIHAYDWPFQTWSIAERARDLIPGKPIWVTESGLALCDVPACGGYCTHDPEQQAAYVLQQFVYARVAGVQVNYHFRMYDDPRQFGLYPASGQPARPAATAARLATQYLSTATLNITDSVMPEAGTLDAFGTFVGIQNHTRLVFDSADGTRRITVLWNNTELPLTNISVPRWSSAVSAELRDQTDKAIQSWTTAPETYSIDLLEAATPLSWAEKDCSIKDNRDPAKLNGYSGPAVGGTTYLLIESRATASTPTGGAAVVCANGRAVGADLWAYDADSGLQSLTVACSPEVTYDLSWTQPGVHYAGTVRTAPAPAAVCTLTLTDRDGLTLQQTLRNDCRNDGSGGSTPGGDHPDDNFSAAGIPAGASGVLDGNFFVLPEGARAAPRVAILNNGFAHNLWRLLAQLGEPANYVGSDFDPVTVAQYPVLLIPSGESANQRVSEPTAILYLYTVTFYADGAPVCSSFIVTLFIPSTCPTCVAA